MNSETREALVAALKALDDLKDLLPDDKKSVIEEAGDQIIAGLGGFPAGDGESSTRSCGAAWLYEDTQPM